MFLYFSFIAEYNYASMINTNAFFSFFFDVIHIQVPATTVAHGGRGGGGGRGRRPRKKSVAQQTVQECHGHFVRLVRAIGVEVTLVVVLVILVIHF